MSLWAWKTLDLTTVTGSMFGDTGVRKWFRDRIRQRVQGTREQCTTTRVFLKRSSAFLLPFKVQMAQTVGISRSYFKAFLDYFSMFKIFSCYFTISSSEPYIHRSRSFHSKQRHIRKITSTFLHVMFSEWRNSSIWKSEAEKRLRTPDTCWRVVDQGD